MGKLKRGDWVKVHWLQEPKNIALVLKYQPSKDLLVCYWPDLGATVRVDPYAPSKYAIIGRASKMELLIYDGELNAPDET